MREPMDEGDIAADYQARHNAAALEEHRRAMEQALTGPGFEVCEECGGKIPAERRKARPGCVLCVACKEAQEASERRGEWSNP